MYKTLSFPDLGLAFRRPFVFFGKRTRQFNQTACPPSMTHRAAIIMILAAVGHLGVRGFLPAGRFALRAPFSVSRSIGRAASFSGSPTALSATDAVSSADATGALHVVPRMKVRNIIESPAEAVLGKEVYLKGWVRTLRAQKELAFIEVNDGSFRQGLQAVAESSIPTFGAVSTLSTGAAVSIRGIVIESPVRMHAVQCVFCFAHGFGSRIPSGVALFHQ